MHGFLVGHSRWLCVGQRKLACQPSGTGVCALHVVTRLCFASTPHVAVDQRCLFSRWATFAAIGGIDDIEDHTAKAAGLPPIDSINLWGYISGTEATSPRTHVIIGDGNGGVGGIVAATATGEIWKCLQGLLNMAGWTSQISPNATFKTPGSAWCKPFCLYQIDTDPSEYVDLVNSTNSTVAAIGAKLRQRMKTAAATGFRPSRGSQDNASCIAAVNEWNGYWGPWVRE